MMTDGCLLGKLGRCGRHFRLRVLAGTGHGLKGDPVGGSTDVQYTTLNQWITCFEGKQALNLNKPVAFHLPQYKFI